MVRSEEKKERKEMSLYTHEAAREKSRPDRSRNSVPVAIPCKTLFFLRRDLKKKPEPSQKKNEDLRSHSRPALLGGLLRQRRGEGRQIPLRRAEDHSHLVSQI